MEEEKTHWCHISLFLLGCYLSGRLAKWLRCSFSWHHYLENVRAVASTDRKVSPRKKSVLLSQEHTMPMMLVPNMLLWSYKIGTAMRWGTLWCSFVLLGLACIVEMNMVNCWCSHLQRLSYLLNQICRTELLIHPLRQALQEMLLYRFLFYLPSNILRCNALLSFLKVVPLWSKSRHLLGKIRAP